jgi:spermidine synthase
LPLIRGPQGGNPDSSLVIGLGAGQLPMLLMENSVEVEAVEIDPVIEVMARKHFAFDIRPQQLHITDGRLFLEQTPDRYDYIFMDAFNADQVPWHLLSAEALEIACSRLEDGGIVALNTVSLPGSDEVTAVNATLKSVFPYVRVFKSSQDRHLTNIVFLASDTPIRLVPFKQDLDNEQAHIVLQFLAGEIVDLTDGLVLNDDYNPINHLHETAQAQWREDMRALLGEDYYDWAFY